MLGLEVKNGNNEVDEFSVSYSEELAKKSEKLFKFQKLFKLRKLKSEKLVIF